MVGGTSLSRPGRIVDASLTRTIIKGRNVHRGTSARRAGGWSPGRSHQTDEARDEHAYHARSNSTVSSHKHGVTASGTPRTADPKCERPPPEVGVLQEIPAATYSPRGEPPSTIGAGGLDCCVRNGNRYISTAITTGNCALDRFRGPNRSTRLLERPRTSTNIKLQALGRLVPVS